MSLAQLQAFMADLDAIKSGSRFYHPTVNYGDRFGRDSSVANLVRHLTANPNSAAMTLADAMGHLSNPDDTRLKKYMPAIERLVRVWGTAQPYPNPVAIPASTPDRDTALFNFARAIRRIQPAHIRPSWQDLESPDGQPKDAYRFGIALGPGYIQRIQLGGGNNLDITARSLLLGAGLAPQLPLNDTGYIGNLKLTLAHLEAMKGGSVLDVGCGGAFFGAEMHVLFSCNANGIDLHPLQAPAIAEGQRRYVRSMLYLKMLRDRRQLPQVAEVPRWAFNYIDRIIDNLPQILQFYGNNPPAQGDLLNNFNATALAIRPGRWSHSVTMNVLCYLNAAQQTTAVNAMCGVTTRRIHLYNGSGSVPTTSLGYDQQAIRRNYHGCVITQVNPRTHRIDR